MSNDTSKREEAPFIPPVSAFAGPIAELVGHRLLSPPTRPGLLASLARYEVTRVLGGGGMGVVVLAHDSENGKDVAIKLVRPELVSEQRMVHRFVKEAGHLQKLKHPNIVPVLEVSDRAEGPYFVMPYFENGSLAQRIRPGRPMEADAILDIAREIADGLTFAHRHGIIHRDLKPANILIGADGKSCLADFGLARTMFNDSIIDVEREQLEGTAPYMSPAVAAGHAEDTRCDIYAFGALLYEMLTGDPPYAGRNTSDIRQQILAGPPKPIRERNPAADPGLSTIAEGAMGRELRDRYADMADVGADLDRVKAGKSPLGPRGLTARVKNMPVSMWIPTGIVLMGLGLWLVWSGTPNKTTPTPPPVPMTPKPAPLPPPVSTHPLPQLEPIHPIPLPAQSDYNKWYVSILAGQPGVAGSADGTGAAASFRSPQGIAVDGFRNVYVADTGNNTIRKITPAGVVTTFAGTAGKPGRSDGAGADARFMAPLGIAANTLETVYVAEFANDTIRKITPNGVVTTLAGSSGIPGSDDGTGDNAHFRNPWSVAVDPTGNVFVADKSNFTIRQITPTGRVSTTAGKPGVPGKADGPGSYARFSDPHSVAAAGMVGVVYVADTGNCEIRAIKSGIVSTLAGKAGSPGSTDGKGSAARFSDVQSLAVGELGNIYVLDGQLIRKVTPDGAVTTLPKAALAGENNEAVNATAIAVDGSGNLYVLDGMNNVVWVARPREPGYHLPPPRK